MATALIMPAATKRLELLGDLADALTLGQAAAAIEGMAQTETTCISASVVWGLDQTAVERIEPRLPLGDADRQFLRAATMSLAPIFSADGRRLAIPLSQTKRTTPHPAVLLVTVNTRSDGQRFIDALGKQMEVAGRYFCRLLEAADLRSSLKRLERSEGLQRALFAISDLAGSDRDMPDMLRGIHAIVGSLMYAENFYIVLHDAQCETLRFLYYADVEDPVTPGGSADIPMSVLKGALTWYLLRDGKPLMGNTQELRQQVSGPLAIVGPDSYDWLGVPMLRDGQVRGAVVVQSYRQGIAFSVDDRSLLEFVGNHILIALERKQSKENLEERVRLRTIELADANRGLQLEVIERQRAERLQGALFKIAQLATEDISQTDFYGRIHRAVGELINAENFYIGLLSEDGTSLEFPYYVDATRTPQRARRLGRGLSEYVIRHRTPLTGLTDDILARAKKGEFEIPASGIPPVCWMGVPLLVGEEVIGLVAVQSYDPAVVYGASDQGLLSFVASQVANSLHRRRSAQTLQRAYSLLEERVQERTQALSKEIAERERVQHQLKRQVMHDALTALPNRGYLMERLHGVLTRLKRDPDRRYALLFIDIDRFKIINDSLGHMVGDDVLKEVARRLLTCVREPDLVARLSGDEFAILLENVQTAASAIAVAERVLLALAAPLQLAGRELTPSASIGIVLGDQRYQIAGDVLRDADKTMYRAKKKGRGRFELFDESVQQTTDDVLTLENDLRLAQLHRQFEPHFQPIVCLTSGATRGYEALIRWNHPTRGILVPADFLTIAEENGSLEAIDWRMFERSCELATRLVHDDIFLSLNVSPRHFHRIEFSTQLLAMLDRTGLSARRLLVELTEGSLIDHPEQARAALKRLRDAGIGAAVDDFGTGYSSLSYLHTFPLRMLKIDRTFVAELGKEGKSSASVVAAILALARALDMDVVAEGIETTEQRDALVAMGCVLGQGFLLGYPAPIAHWLNAEGKRA